MGLAALIVLGVLGCEHGVDGSGTIRVPEDVQHLFSAENPGQVVVRVDWPEGPAAQAVGYLCAPGAAPTTFRFRTFRFDCAQKANLNVHAWAAAAPRSIPAERCGQLDDPDDPAPLTEATDAIAYANDQASIEPWDSVGACNDGSFRFDLTLEPGGAEGAER